ncbi:uncharacterized protein LOC115221725 [Octopus sinensis]|uniref:Uncharacterized protein LOC115221725 n=1 Tax=Octopus sinensis TaxID=2607531 RepID=A0A6P7TE12_9MOLL|nr:uncharacterized protein LOC115221725 [Octopus sinensis]
MSNAPSKGMAEGTLKSVGDAEFATSPNGHTTECSDTEMEYKRNCVDQKDAPRKSQSYNRLGSQCYSKLPLPYQSALSDNKTFKDSINPDEVNEANTLSSPSFNSKANPQLSYHLDSPLRSCQKQSGSRFLRCELCNKLFSEDDAKNEDAHISKKKITVCQVCNQKYSVLEDIADKKPPPKEILDNSLLPTTYPPKLVYDNCNDIPSKNIKQIKNGSQIVVSDTNTKTEHLLKNVKQEPVSENDGNLSTGIKLPLKHSFQSSCSFFLTTNLKPCIKRNQEVKNKKKDSVPSENTNKKARLGDSDLAKNVSADQEQLVTVDVSKNTVACSPVLPKVYGTEGYSQNYFKLEPPNVSDCAKEAKKTVHIKSKSTNETDFTFKLPSVTSTYSTGKNVNKSKSDPTSNTYTFEGSMMWNPVTNIPTTQEQQKSDKKDGISETNSCPKSERKDDESTYSCEGSLFIKPVLPNEFAFEGTLYIKPDSPHFLQTTVDSSPATSTASPSNLTNKIVNIQSVFTSSGQVISSVTVPATDQSRTIPNNQRMPTNVCRTYARTTTTNSTVVPRMTSSIPTSMPKVQKIISEEKKDLPVRKQALNSGSGGGHTDFSVKSILSTPDRRGTVGNSGMPQEQ